MTVFFITNLSRIVVQDIRRFFAPTSAKPAVQKPAPNGNFKSEEEKKKKKKNPLSSDEEVKKKDNVRKCCDLTKVPLFTNLKLCCSYLFISITSRLWCVFLSLNQT